MDNFSVSSFFVGLAASFYIQTLNPEIWKVRKRMLIAAGVFFLIGVAWPLIGMLFPAFALSDFAVSMVSFTSSHWTWFSLLMVSLIANSLVPAMERRRASQQVSSQAAPVELTPPPSPAPLSPRDEANREKIVVFSREYARLVYAVAQQITNRLWDHIRNSDDPKDWAIATLVNNHAFAFCNHAAAALSNAVNDPHNSIDVLKQRLREFYDAYQRLVRWGHSLAALFSYPVKEDMDYSVWEERHKLFHQALRNLTAPDDFSQLRKRLHGLDDDILR